METGKGVVYSLRFYDAGEAVDDVSAEFEEVGENEWSIVATLKDGCDIQFVVASLKALVEQLQTSHYMRRVHRLAEAARERQQKERDADDFISDIPF